MLPELNAQLGIERIRLSDGARTVLADVIADGAIVANGQDAAGDVLELDGRAGQCQGPPAWGIGHQVAAILDEGGAGDLATAGATRLCNTSRAKSGGQE